MKVATITQTLTDIKRDEDLKIYFNWTCNVLLPLFPGAADRYFRKHAEIITRQARYILDPLNCYPDTIYRGLIVRNEITEIAPHRNLEYLSFSDSVNVAEHFADINGFGSDIINVREQLGAYGYVIEYNPRPDEILFHYRLLDMFPYAEAFDHIGVMGAREVIGLKKQREIVIRQPAEPLTRFREFSSLLATTI